MHAHINISCRFIWCDYFFGFFFFYYEFDTTTIIIYNDRFFVGIFVDFGIGTFTHADFVTSISGLRLTLSLSLFFLLLPLSCFPFIAKNTRDVIHIFIAQTYTTTQKVWIYIYYGPCAQGIFPLNSSIKTLQK